MIHYNRLQFLCICFFLSFQTSFSQPYLVGYWQNWNDGSSPYIALDQIDTRYNVVNLSFAIPVGGTDYDMGFPLCCGETQAGLIAKIQTLQAAGKIVNISIGGATAPIHLDNLTEKNTFISSMNTLINTYGFDGLDIDLEGSSLSVSASSSIANPTDVAVVNMIDAIQQIMATYQTNFSKKMFLSAAPETAFVQGALSSWGGIWGAYLPLLDALRNDMDLLHVQLYNSGSMYGLDGNIYNQGTPDFLVSQVETVIQGFTTVGNGGYFTGFPASKVAIGLPACPSAAGGGFTSVANAKAAADYLMGNGGQPGSYTLQGGPYPDLAGLMTWSINWDNVNSCNATSGEFALNYVDIFESGTCWQPDLGADLSICTLTFPYQLNSGTTTNPNVTFTWTNMTTGQILVMNSPTTNTFMINSAGTYQVKRDSMGCVKLAVVTISNDLPIPNIGGDENLCSVLPASISVSNDGDFPSGSTFQWYKNNVLMSGETGIILNDIRTAGTYKITANYQNCAQETEIIVTSDMPEPVDGCGQSGSSIPLSINASGGGPYEWFDAATNGNSLGTGTNYTTPNLTTTTTYFVENTGSVGSATTGPDTYPADLGTLGNYLQPTEITFDAFSTFTIKELTVYPLIWCNTHTLSFEIHNSMGAVLPNGSQSFSITETDCDNVAGPILLTLSGNGVEIPMGTGYKIVQTGNIGFNHWQGPVSYPMDYSPYFQITSTDVANTYAAIHDWKVEGGSCARLPVIAEINPSCNLILPVELIDFQVEKRNQAAYLFWETAAEINHQHFELQKSKNGVDFKTIETFLAQSVNGAFYDYLDKEIELGQPYYYRLKQVDYDGKFTFSEIKTIIFAKEHKEITIYPNPTKEVLYFENWDSKQEENWKIEMYDATGKLVLNEVLQQPNLQINQLIKGIYWVKVVNGKSLVVQRILVN